MKTLGSVPTIALLALLVPAAVNAENGGLYRWTTYDCVPEEMSGPTSFEIMNFKPSYGAPKVAEAQWRAGWGFARHDGVPPEERIRTTWTGEIRNQETDELLDIFEDRSRFDRNGNFAFSAPLPQLPPDVDGAILEVRPFTDSPVLIDQCTMTFGVRPADPSCIPGASTLCLGDDGRFRVELDFVNLDGTTRTAMAQRTGKSEGFFWFFNQSQAEMIVDVQNRCSGPSPAHWVSYERRTPFANRLIVTDTATGEVKVYEGLGSSPSPPITDIEAFSTCP